MKNDLRDINISAGSRSNVLILENVFNDYIQSYKGHLAAWLKAKGEFVIYNRVTAGAGARLNLLKMEEQELFSKFRNWRGRQKYHYLRLFRPTKCLSQLKNKLQERERLHSMMVTANEFIRKGKGDIKEQLEKLGFYDQRAGWILAPRRFESPGFTTQTIANNRAEIRRLQKQMVKYEAAALQGTTFMVHNIQKPGKTNSSMETSPGKVASL
ncbi:hypothetical protein [[Flexibacter] sp. ATCC 35208]|uniref:hypothetical protein n=1 Tax=[Flexibacter] sp. ATCC 35208 TaxID=1936242 RepID=UPI0015C31615|nr:hypothetical protein [[Flexibacter] sp. ATCC 35208]